MFGGGGPKAKKDMRRIEVGTVWKPKLDFARATITTLVNNKKELRGVALVEPVIRTGPAVRFLGQFLVPKLGEPKSAAKEAHVGLTAAVVGEDYAASLRCMRVREGVDAGVSYHQRLAPTSPITIGGEVFVCGPAVTAATTVQDDGRLGSDRKPLEWAVGASHTGQDSKTSLHYASTSSAPALSAHHVYYLNKSNTLVAKTIINPATLSSMVAVGCRLQGTNALGSVTSSVDTYGGLRMVLEHTPIQDVKVGMGMTYNLFNPGKQNEFGFKISYGAPQPLRRPLSPCTMYRDIFALN